MSNILVILMDLLKGGGGGGGGVGQGLGSWTLLTELSPDRNRCSRVMR